MSNRIDKQMQDEVNEIRKRKVRRESGLEQVSDFDRIIMMMTS